MRGWVRIDIAIRLGINSAEIGTLFPEFRIISDFMNPPTTLRSYHKRLLQDHPNIFDIQHYLVENTFYVYRCRSISDTLYRGQIEFAFDRTGRLLCTLHNGDAPYEGIVYVSETVTNAVLIRIDNAEEFELLHLCWSHINRRHEITGLYLGQTDGGRDPCCGRILIVRKNPTDTKIPGPIERAEWSEAQLKLFMKYINTKTPDSPSIYALIAEGNFLASCQPGQKAMLVQR